MSYGDDLWETITIKEWDEFDSHVEKLDHRDWLFRGQSDRKYELKSSLFRLFEDIQQITLPHKGMEWRFKKDTHERLLIEQFQAHAHLYLATLPQKEDILEWLAIMQHYGAPTRMLDVTLSPHIAAYFALEAGHGDCCIYTFNHKMFTQIDEKELGKDYKITIFDDHRYEKSFFIPYEPKMMNERLVAQQGLFLVPSTNYQTLEEILEIYGYEKGEASKKYIIPSHLRYEGMRRLRRMNITSATLFPGIDGFCKSLRYQILETTGRLRSIR